MCLQTPDTVACVEWTKAEARTEDLGSAAWRALSQPAPRGRDLKSESAVTVVKRQALVAMGRVPSAGGPGPPSREVSFEMSDNLRAQLRRTVHLEQVRVPGFIQLQAARCRMAACELG